MPARKELRRKWGILRSSLFIIINLTWKNFLPAFLKPLKALALNQSVYLTR
jgi:hypothetical protein